MQFLRKLRRLFSLRYNLTMMAPRKAVFQWSRWLLVGTIAVMGAALLLTAWITYRGVSDATSALVRGQAAALQADLRGEFRSLQTNGAVPTQDDLDEILQVYTESGLRYIALMGHGKIVLSAGTSEVQPSNRVSSLHRLKGDEVLQYDERVGMVLRAPGPRRPRVRRRNLAHRDMPAIYIEFVPTQARILRESSRRTLAVGTGASALMILMALVLVRWFSRQDKERLREEQDRRLKSLGQMSAVLAHEIRNPLASLKGNAQILEQLVAQDREPDSKPVRKAERVVHEASRLEVLVNDLLDFVRSGELRKQRISPADLLRDCAEKVSAESISVHDSQVPEAWNLDPMRMGQVLENLLRNAVQASDKVDATVCTKDGRLVFLVRDYGSGFDASDANQLFEPFYTARSHGTGLGLAVAKRLVELHGGTIRATNAVGGGAEFRVEIPPG